jgi:hypothetical protein
MGETAVSPVAAGNVCAKCGGEMDEGTVGASAIHLWYKPDTVDAQHQSFRLTTRTTINVTSARACLSCGYLELYIEPRS